MAWSNKFYFMSNEDVKIARLEEKYTGLEKEVTEVKEVVIKIRDNHLSHLKDQITDLDKKMTYFIGIGTTLLTILQLIFKFYK